MSDTYYRGEPQVYDFPCEPSIFRCVKNCIDQLDAESKLYKEILENLKKSNLLKFTNKVDNDIDTLKKLSIIQHYFSCSRLLDITDDENVAIYFACCKDFDKDGIIYSFKKGNNDLKEIDSEETASIVRKLKCISNYSIYKNKDLVKTFTAEQNNTKSEIKKSTIVCNNIVDFKKTFNVNSENLRYEVQHGKFILFGICLNENNIIENNKQITVEPDESQRISANDKINKLFKLTTSSSNNYINHCILFPDDAETFNINRDYILFQYSENKSEMLKKLCVEKELLIFEDIKQYIDLIVSNKNIFQFIFYEFKIYYKNIIDKKFAINELEKLLNSLKTDFTF